MGAIRLVYSHISIRWYKFRPYYDYGCRLQRESHLQELLSVNWPNAWMGIKDPAVLRRIQDWLYRDGNDGCLTEPQQQFRAGWVESSQEHLLLSSSSCSISTSLFLNLCCRSPHPLIPKPTRSDQRWILKLQYLIFVYKLSVFPPPPSDFVHWFNSHRKENKFWENWQK